MTILVFHDFFSNLPGTIVPLQENCLYELGKTFVEYPDEESLSRPLRLIR